jgi:hypothetical protein
LKRQVTVTITTENDADPGAELQIHTTFNPPLETGEASATAVVAGVVLDALRRFAERAG